MKKRPVVDSEVGGGGGGGGGQCKSCMISGLDYGLEYGLDSNF